MSQSPSNGRGLRPKESAARLGCSVATHYRNSKKVPGWPPIIRVTPRISITPEAAIDEFLAKRAAAS